MQGLILTSDWHSIQWKVRDELYRKTFRT